MLKHMNAVTPCVLVAIAFPFLFILAPDGIPFALACNSSAHTGTVLNLGTDGPRNCTGWYPYEYITIYEASATKEYGYCMIWVNVDLYISGSCNALWIKWCDDYKCSGTIAAQGPGHFDIDTSNGCLNDQDVISIWLTADIQTCECTVTGGGGDQIMFSASGTCDY